MNIKSFLQKFARPVALCMTAGVIAFTMTSFTGCGNEKAGAMEKFVIAYLPNEANEHSADSRNGLSKELSELLGIKVEEYIASDYAAIVESMAQGGVDMAYFGPLSFCQAYDRAKAEPLGMRAKGGSKELATYNTHFVVKADSDIQSLKDIKGTVIGFVDPNSTSGYLVPAYEIMQTFPDENLSLNDLESNGKFFKTATFTNKHQAGLQAVLKGDVDVVPISSTILAQEIELGNAKESDIRIIHTSFPIPAEPMAIRGGVPKEIKDKVKDFILAYDNEKYFEDIVGDPTSRFVPCTIDDYKEIVELNKLLNE